MCLHRGAFTRRFPSRVYRTERPGVTRGVYVLWYAAAASQYLQGGRVLPRNIRAKRYIQFLEYLIGGGAAEIRPGV